LHRYRTAKGMTDEYDRLIDADCIAKCVDPRCIRVQAADLEGGQRRRVHAHAGGDESLQRGAIRTAAQPPAMKKHERRTVATDSVRGRRSFDFDLWPVEQVRRFRLHNVSTVGEHPHMRADIPRGQKSLHYCAVRPNSSARFGRLPFRRMSDADLEMLRTVP